VDLSRSVDGLLRLIEFTRQAYELVVIDCGTAYGPWALSVADQCDEIMLITTNELPMLRAAQRVLASYDRNQIDRTKVRIVVNRFDKALGLNQEAIETALHQDVFHVAPAEPEVVQRAMMEGKPVTGSSNFGKSMEQLAEKLAPRKHTGEGAKAKNTSSVGSFITSIFSK
jgi:pilus assembly protein CpaE